MAEAEQAGSEATKPVSPLLDLPVELRLHIYTFALVQPGPIWLEGTAAKIISSSAGPWPNVFSAGPTASTLLKVNKQVHLEAKPILYGANCFHPESEEILDAFLTSIGISVKYVSAIDLGFTYTYRSAQSAMLLLGSLPRLKTIYLEMSQLECCVRNLTLSEDPRTWARMLADDFRDMLLRMQVRKREGDVIWKPADLFHFRVQELANSHEEGAAGKAVECVCLFREMVEEYLHSEQRGE